MKITSMLVTGIAIALLCVSFVFGQDRYILDLTLPSATLAPPRNYSGCGPRLSAGSAGGELVVRPLLPLAVEIVSLDKSAYVLGGNMVCQIRLKNVGHRAVRIPWSPNSDYGNKDCTPGIKGLETAALTGYASLVLRTDSGITREILLKSLYGRLSMPKTYRTLGPGQSASIKFKALVGLFNPRTHDFSSGSIELPQSFSATANYDLDDTSQGNPYKTVYSINRVELTILGQARAQ